MWRSYTEKYPRWVDEGADLTPVGIKAFFETVAMLAFAAGVKRGRADQCLPEDLAQRRSRNARRFLDQIDAFGVPDLEQEETPGPAGLARPA